MGAAGRRWMLRTALVLALCPAPRHALAAEDEFYKGKTVTLVVGYSVGGGYDQYARGAGAPSGSRIPGNPTVLVQNMPGAASLTAVRYLDANAPKDGTVITTFDPGLITESFASPDIFKAQIPGLPVDRHHAARHPHLLCVGRNRHQDLGRHDAAQGVPDRHHRQGLQRLCERRHPAQDFQRAGASRSPAIRAATSSGSRSSAASSKAIAAPGARCRRTGWCTTSSIRWCASRPSVRPTCRQSVPFISDLATTAEQKDLLAVLNASAELGRPFIVAKTVPPQRVNVLRTAFRAALDDPAFRAEAQAQSLPLDPVPGEEAAAIIAKILFGIAGAGPQGQGCARIVGPGAE